MYQQIVNDSNHFIKKIPNSKKLNFNEVFEIFTIIIVFYLKKLKDRNTRESKEISQIIIDTFFKDLDQNFREQGIGDMSIGKYVKKHVKKFYFRLKILDTILKENTNINFNDYFVKIGLLNSWNIDQINKDLNILYNDIDIEK